VTTPDPLQRIRGGLVVSCQAYPGEPMRFPMIMAAVAEAAMAGGAVGIRVEGLADLTLIRARTSAPLIGLLKIAGTPVSITPTVAAAEQVAATGADLVALDGTTRARPDGRPLADSIAAVHAAGRLAMADCATVEDAEWSVAAGADCVSTTLAGYTPSRPATAGPDLELLAALIDRVGVPVIAEGRIGTPAEAARCLAMGAYAVVVGSAITHPTRITRTFVAALGDEWPR
jgi:N-acylglucosamine-6-phosphate 2-epimerase